MIVFIWILGAILWGACIIVRWKTLENTDNLDTDQYWAAALIGLFWPLTLPAYMLRWAVEFVARNMLGAIKDNDVS